MPEAETDQVLGSVLHLLVPFSGVQDCKAKNLNGITLSEHTQTEASGSQSVWQTLLCPCYERWHCGSVTSAGVTVGAS